MEFIVTLVVSDPSLPYLQKEQFTSMMQQLKAFYLQQNPKAVAYSLLIIPKKTGVTFSEVGVTNP